MGVGGVGVEVWEGGGGVAVAAVAGACGALIVFWRGIRIACSEPFPASRSGATIFRVDSTDTPQLKASECPWNPRGKWWLRNETREMVRKMQCEFLAKTQ